jgi:serine/threonine protein kinase
MVLQVIEPPSFNNTSQCVLKLFDRRFSTQAREGCRTKPWSPEIEQQYQGFVNCDDAREFFSYWDAEKERDNQWSVAYVDNRNRWSAAKLETYLQWSCHSMYEAEKKAYELMSGIQGEYVPKVFECVVLNQPDAFRQLGDDDGEPDDMDKAIRSIPGILMQYHDGFHLTDLHKHLPSEHWQSILDSAVQTIGKIQACGIYNRDVNTRSFMVDPSTHHVMMIDFGLQETGKGSRHHTTKKVLSGRSCQDI